MILSVAVSAHAQARIVQGHIVPSGGWTVIHDPIEITGFSGGSVLCKTYSERDEVSGYTAVAGSKRGLTQATTRRVRDYKELIALTNYPTAASLQLGSVIRETMGVRVGQVIVPKGNNTFDSYTLYDYGTPYTLPARQLTPEEAAAAKAQVAKRATAGEAAKLKFDEEQADLGKDLYQYRMGMRYLIGDGVPADRSKALQYLSKSATQGNEDAKRALTKYSKDAPQEEAAKP
jgi:hypothetical protein